MRDDYSGMLDVVSYASLLLYQVIEFSRWISDVFDANKAYSVTSSNTERRQDLWCYL